MGYVYPTVTDFKQYFFRDFPYGTTLDTVTDTDIFNAMGESNVNFNESLFGNQGSFNIGYLLLTAHYLVMDLRQSSQGVAGRFNWAEASKSVGNVSQSFAIPQRILDNPEFSYLASTNYGTKFLMLILPQLTGQMFTVFGRTNP